VSDSLWAGVDGTAISWVFDYDDNATQWRTQSLTVNSTGAHTVDVWAREDGIAIQKIVVNQSPTAPSGSGPAESPKQ
jgi:hypothetical protein